MKTFNADYKKRNQIVFGDDDVEGETWLGGTRHFEALDFKQLERLVDNDFIDLEGTQNCSPSAGEFMEFLEKYPKATAHGYAVSHKRDDYRVSLEGVGFRGRVSKKLLMDFVYLCRHADEFHAGDGELYAWWD
jgi:hypothetical protein